MTLVVEAGELPLKLRMSEILIRRLCRLEEKSTSHPYPHLREAANSALFAETGEQIPNIAKLHRDTIRPWHNKTIKVDWTIKHGFKKGQNSMNATALVHELLHTKYDKHDKFYTDGSKCDNLVGLAVVGRGITVEKSLPFQCSVYSAEATALHTAVCLADRSPTVILSDSASCLTALNKGKSKHPFIQAVEREALNKDVTFCWIPGHSGISGNEDADHAAHRGRISHLAQVEIPAIDVINWAHHLFQLAFQAAWESHRPTFLKRCKTTTKKWNDREDRVLTRLRIGHTRLTKEHLYNKLVSKNCDVCHTELSVEHIVSNCIKYDNIREELGINSDLKIALGNNKHEEVKILKFFKKCKLYDKL